MNAGDCRNWNRFVAVWGVCPGAGKSTIADSACGVADRGGRGRGITIVANPVRAIRKIAYGACNALRAPTLNRTVLIRYLLMLYEVFG